MSRKFSVGQRVRIVKVDRRTDLLGTETVITAIDRAGLHEIDIPSDIDVDYWPHFWCRAEQIEPIYDGNEKVSWSECAWKPKKVRA